MTETQTNGITQHKRYLSIPIEIFDKMRQVDVSPYVKKLKNLDYLKVEAALLLLKKHFPSLSVEVGEIEIMDDIGCILKLWIYDNETGMVSETLLYPVMGNAYKGHKGLLNPNSREITDSIVRGKVKLIAYVTGIGYDLYLRENDADDSEEEDTPRKSSRKSKSSKSRRTFSSAKLDLDADDEEGDEDDEYDDEDDEYDEEDDEEDDEENKKVANRANSRKRKRSNGLFGGGR